LGNEELIRDVVVVLPGIMGSTLSKNGKLVWAPSAGAVLNAITTFGQNISKLKLPEGIGDNDPHDGVKPVSLMPDLHLLPGIWSAHLGYSNLLDWLRSKFHFIEPVSDALDYIPNLLPVAYDWRLSNRYNGRQLKAIVEPALERWRDQGREFAEAKLIFICHSMGGLVARWYIEKEGGHSITRKLITLGTPYRGALNALAQLVNGVKKWIGPLGLELTSFARSLPSLYQLLPEYACIESHAGLLKTTEAVIPELQTGMIDDAMRFHDEMDVAASTHRSAFDVHPIVGIRQTTLTTTRISGNLIEPLETISGEDKGGDGTVPRLAAIPKDTRPNSNTVRFIADQHGSLQSNQGVFDELFGILTGEPIIYRSSPRIELSLTIDPLVLADQTISVTARIVRDERAVLEARVKDEHGNLVAVAQLRCSEGAHRVSIGRLSPGAYNIIVGGTGALAALVAPVSSVVLVWPS